jgi:predicted ATPase/DNA-binding winged helix-turn-helix (wHTH) protein
VSADPAPAAFAFGPFRLDVVRRELTVHGVAVMMGQRAFDVLLALVARHGQLVTKDELMAEVWPGIVVEENNIQVHVSALRKALGSAGDGERYLLTVAGRGYRFVAPVESIAHAAAKSGANEGAATTAWPGPSAAAHNLPQQLTTLIGREADLAGIATQLGSHRLVTLTGSGGVGKTRLAIEAGGRLLADYPDGVWLAELAPLSDPRLATTIIAKASGVNLADPSAAIEAVASALKHKHLMLIIDNCEHVISEVARVVETLIRECPRLSILATSRERLAIPGESVIRVPSLSVPEAGAELNPSAARDYAAVRLFAERASALGHGFSLTDGNAGAVASLCRRLDGIPLAIELAVPRLNVMSVQQLDRGLDERFRLLTGASRTALPRQQTLHATIDWSYDLLTGQEQQLLGRLSVFLGGSALSSISAVVAEASSGQAGTGSAPKTRPAKEGSADILQDQVGDLLLSLVEKSLVHADPGGNETRYRLLESTRYYAREKLGAAPDLRRRHAGHFAARFAAATTAWETTPTDQWIALYAPDLDNLRGALEWAFGPDGDVALGLDLVGRSHLAWAEIGLMLEHRRWVDEALRRIKDNAKRTPAEVTARLLSWQAGDVRDIDDPADYDEAMRAAGLFHKLGDGFHEGRVLLRAGTARLLPDNVTESERLLHKARALVEPSGPTKSLARCLSALASARLFAGDQAQARTLHAQALRVYRDIGERVEDNRNR